MPRVLVQAVSLAGKYEGRMRHPERLECPFHARSLQVAYAYVRASLHQMGRRFHFVESKQRSLTLIKLRILPGLPAEIPCVIPCLIVIAPVSRVFNGSGPRDSRSKARGLRDEPVGHVAAVAIAADGKMIRVGITVFYERIDAGENVATRLRNQVRLDLQHEVVAIS